MDALWQDVRYAVRSLRRSPGLTLVVLTTLSIGIAVVTTFFSALDSIILRPLPYPDADRIVMIYKRYKSPDRVVDELVRASKAIGRIALYAERTGVLTGAGEPVSVRAVYVDSGFFPLLRMTPILGALPGGRDVIDGPPSIVLGERVWRESYDADSAIIGKSVRIGGQSRRVTAIVSRTFTLPFPTNGAWIPTPRVYEEDSRINVFLARLAPGATNDDLQRDLDLVGARLFASDSATFGAKRQFTLAPEMLNRYFNIGEAVRPLKLVTAAAGCVLLIACTNLALLMIVRGARRRAEMVVRASLGASRWQLVRQQAVESALLAGTSAILGTILSVWGVRLLIALTIPADRRGNLPGWLQFGIDWRVACFAFGIALVAVAMVGLWPARAGTRFDLATVLRSDAGHGIAGADPTRSAHLPIVLQLTLSLALFGGAIMMALTYRQVVRVDRGHDPRGVYDVWVTNDHDSSSLATTEFFRRVRDRLATMPGLEASISTRFESFHGEQSDGSAYLPGATSPVVSPSEWRQDPAVVSDDYFRVIGMPILAGRAFNGGDGAGSMPVAIVSREFALRAWGSPDAIGKLLAVGKPKAVKGLTAPAGAPTLVTVVGVVGDHREPRIGSESLIWSRPDVYVSDRQARFTTATLVVRSNQGQLAVRKAAAAAIEGAGRELPIMVLSREAEAARNDRWSRSLALMMATFALASLGLALIGLYGVVAFSVEQRTREVGVRLALGAQARDVIRLIMLSGAKLAAVGLALGLVVTVMMGRVLGGFVVGAVTSHVAIAVGATGVFAAVALLATYLPARRAARMDPVAALR